MKKNPGFTVLIIAGFAALSLLSTNVMYAATPPSYVFSQKSIPGSVKIKTKEIKSNSEIINVDLKVPVLSGMKNKELQKRLNSKFLSEELDFKNQIEKSAEEFQKYAKEHNIPERPFEAYVSYKVTYNKNNLLSISFYYYKFTGGAHGGTKVISYNIDLKGGKTLALSDLFQSGTEYTEKINAEVGRQMKSSGNLYFQNAFKSISDNQPFYVEDENIVVYFQEYEIAPYAAGIPEFKIPLAMFSNELNLNLNLQKS
jgi:hypothetical protein